MRWEFVMLEEIQLLLIALFVGIGVFGGTAGSLVGIGGGLFFVPALLFFVNLFHPGEMSAQGAASTSLVVVAITALSSTIAYLKQKKVDVSAGLLFFAGSAPGAITGVYVNSMLNVDVFSLFFGLFQICMFLLLVFKDRIKPRNPNWDVTRSYIDEEGREQIYGYKYWLALLIAFTAGFLSSLFGIGGGILIVPMLLIFFHFPPHVATATSMFVIFLSALTGSAINIAQDMVHWYYALAIAPGAWLGGKIGAYISKRTKGKTLVMILRIIVLLVAVQMIVEAL